MELDEDNLEQEVSEQAVLEQVTFEQEASKQEAEITDANINIDEENEVKKSSNFLQELISNLTQVLHKERILTIDRIEENIAVCEDRETRVMFNIDISKLPENVKEGDVIRYENNEFKLDTQAQEEIEDRIQEKTKNLFEE